MNFKFLFNKKLIVFLLLSFFFSLIISFLFVNYIYDQNFNKFISYWLFFIIIFFITSIFFLTILLLLKIFSDRFKEKTGSIIQFRIIAIFFISNTFIFFLIFFLLIFVINVTFDLYLNSSYLKEVENKEKNYQKIIKIEIQKMEAKLKKVIEGEINIKRNDNISGIIVYKKNKIEYSLQATSILPWQNEVVKFNFLKKFNESIFYSGYFLEQGYLYSIYKKKKDSILYSYLVYKYVPHFFKSDILEINFEREKIRNIETTKDHITFLSFFIFGLIYFILFGLTTTFFYFYSKNYFISIAEIINASEKIARGKYDTVVSRSSKDEIKKLVDSFMSMVNQIKENQQRLKRLSELEAWRKAVIYISHEIKNPLTPITLSVDYIKNKSIENSFENYFELDDKFNLIYQKLDLIRNLLSDFSTLAKPKQVNKLSIKAENFLKKFENYLSLYKNIKSEIIINYQDNLNIDVERISQVINNLLKNSIESIQQKKKFKDASKIIISCFKQEKEILISVRDNGLGIKEEQKKKLFQPYFTSKKKGMGLGLAICEKIINEHEGRIFFTSNKEWTEFFIAFKNEIKQKKV